MEMRIDLYSYATRNNITDFYEVDSRIEYGETYLDNKDSLRCEIRAFYLPREIKKNTEVTIYVINKEVEKDYKVSRIYFDETKLKDK